MSHSTQFPVLFMLPSDKEGTQSNITVDKSDASFDPNGEIPFHKPRTHLSPWHDSPLINGQLPEVSSDDTSSLQSIDQFEFEDLSMWTLLPTSGSITSPGPTDGSDNELQVNDDSDIDTEPRKRQKTRTKSITENGRIKIPNVLVKSQDKRFTIVNGGLRKSRLPRLQNFATSGVGSADTREAISNKTSLLTVENKAEPSSTTSISSYIQIDKSSLSSTNPTIIRAKPALSQDPSLKEGTGSSISTSHRKRINGLSGLLVPRGLVMSKSASNSDSLNSGALKDHEELSRRTRGLALRPTNSSYGTKLKKSQGRKADQNELELWTNADVAHVRFRKPDELRLLNEVEEESAKRNVRYILMETETKSSNENVASNEMTVLQNQVAVAASTIYTRCDDLEEEIFGPGNRNRGIKGLGKQKPSEQSRASSNTDLPIVTRSKVTNSNTNIQQDNEKEVITNPDPSVKYSFISKAPAKGVDQIVNSPAADVMETRESQASPSCTSTSVDGYEMDLSDITTKAMSHSGEHELFRKMQGLSSEDVTVLGKRSREGMIAEAEKRDITIRHDVVGEGAEEVPEDEEIEVDELEMDELLETPSETLEWTKMVKNTQALDEVGMVVISDVENTLERQYPSIDNDEDQEDEEMRHEVDSPQVPVPQFEEWSTTLRALIKGKKRFQHQDLINLKNILQEIYNNRANISATSSLAQEVYEVSQLEDHDVPNKDELGLRGLARKSTGHWKQSHA